MLTQPVSVRQVTAKPRSRLIWPRTGAACSYSASAASLVGAIPYRPLFVFPFPVLPALPVFVGIERDAMLAALIFIDHVGGPLQPGKAIAEPDIEPVCATALLRIHG